VTPLLADSSSPILLFRFPRSHPRMSFPIIPQSVEPTAIPRFPLRGGSWAITRDQDPALHFPAFVPRFVSRVSQSPCFSHQQVKPHVFVRLFFCRRAKEHYPPLNHQPSKFPQGRRSLSDTTTFLQVSGTLPEIVQTCFFFSQLQIGISSNPAPTPLSFPHVHPQETVLVSTIPRRPL